MVGDWIYRLFTNKACVYENQMQYSKANESLTELIAKLFADGIITQDLKEAVEKYQVKMSGKEKFLAYWVRKSITMSFDAMTTLPVESMNNNIKHKSKVRIRLKLE